MGPLGPSLRWNLSGSKMSKLAPNTVNMVSKATSAKHCCERLFIPALAPVAVHTGAFGSTEIMAAVARRVFEILGILYKSYQF